MKVGGEIWEPREASTSVRESVTGDWSAPCVRVLCVSSVDVWTEHIMLTARNLEGVKPQLQGREREREKLRERRRGGEGKSVRAWRQVEPSASPSLSVTHTHTHGGGRKGRGEQIRGAAKKRGRVESNHTSEADHCQPKNTSRVGRRTMIEELRGRAEREEGKKQPSVKSARADLRPLGSIRF